MTFSGSSVLEQLSVSLLIERCNAEKVDRATEQKVKSTVDHNPFHLCYTSAVFTPTCTRRFLTLGNLTAYRRSSSFFLSFLFRVLKMSQCVLSGSGEVRLIISLHQKCQINYTMWFCNLVLNKDKYFLSLFFFC